MLYSVIRRLMNEAPAVAASEFCKIEGTLAAAEWRRPRSIRGFSMQDEALYVCDGCGEEIVVPIDVSAGASQDYVEDCPVCCRPNLVHVRFADDGECAVWSEPE